MYAWPCDGNFPNPIRPRRVSLNVLASKRRDDARVASLKMCRKVNLQCKQVAGTRCKHARWREHATLPSRPISTQVSSAGGAKCAAKANERGGHIGTGYTISLLYTFDHISHQFAPNLRELAKLQWTGRFTKALANL